MLVDTSKWPFYCGKWDITLITLSQFEIYRPTGTYFVCAPESLRNGRNGEVLSRVADDQGFLMVAQLMELMGPLKYRRIRICNAPWWEIIWNWRLGPWLQGNKGIKWIKPSMVRGSQLSQLKYGWIGFKTKIWCAEAKQILSRWLTMGESQKEVAKVSHAGASGGTSKKVSDFSDVAISIENSQNFTGWAGNIYGTIWDSVGSLNSKIPMIQSTINLQMDGNRCLKSLKSSFHRFSRRNPMGRNGLKWVEMGWSMYGSYPLQITPLRTLFRSAFKCRMAPKICASLEIRIGPTWSNCQKMSKAWIVFKICWNVSSPKYWSMISDVFLFIIFTVLTRYVWFEIWWSLVESSPPLRKIQPRCLKPVRLDFLES